MASWSDHTKLGHKLRACILTFVPCFFVHHCSYCITLVNTILHFLFQVFRDRKWLGSISYTEGHMTYPTSPPIAERAPSSYTVRKVSFHPGILVLVNKWKMAVFLSDQLPFSFVWEFYGVRQFSRVVNFFLIHQTMISLDWNCLVFTLFFSLFFVLGMPWKSWRNISKSYHRQGNGEVALHVFISHKLKNPRWRYNYIAEQFSLNSLASFEWKD